jgi:beta-glucosidase
MKGRTYRYATEAPLFPFGFGLSYTQFSYHDLHLSASEISPREKLEVQVSVTNTGNMDAEEVVQLYVSDLEASVDVPQYALKGFQRVMLRANDTATLTFTLTPEMLMLVNETGEFVLEPGEFRVTIGGSSPGPRSAELGAATPVSSSFSVV